MSKHILPLTTWHHYSILRILQEREPWDLISFEAYLRYGTSNKEHEWFGEFRQGRLVGLIYHHAGTVDLIYPTLPKEDSLLYSFLALRYPHFIIHGNKEVIEAVLKKIPYKVDKIEEGEFLIQSKETKELLQTQALKQPKGYIIRNSLATDYFQILKLLEDPAIENRMDSSLIQLLCHEGRIVLLVKQDRSWSPLVGLLMILKESPRYSLIGGLYVEKEERNKGLASWLGYKVLREITNKGKIACFYYSEKELSEFYQRGAFHQMGKWVTYQVMKS